MQIAQGSNVPISSFDFAFRMRLRVGEQVVQVLPVELLPVLPVVSGELVVDFSSILVFDLFEVLRFMLFIPLLTESPGMPLLLLQAMLLFGRQLKLSLLECPLIWSQPGICGRKQRQEIVRAVIQLQSEVCQMVHLRRVVWKRIGLPDCDCLASLLVGGCDLVSPLPVYLPRVSGSWPDWDRARNNGHVLPRPSASLELQRQLQPLLRWHQLIVLAYLFTNELPRVLYVNVAKYDVVRC